MGIPFHLILKNQTHRECLVFELSWFLGWDLWCVESVFRLREHFIRGPGSDGILEILERSYEIEFICSAIDIPNKGPLKRSKLSVLLAKTCLVCCSNCRKTVLPETLYAAVFHSLLHQLTSSTPSPAGLMLSQLAFSGSLGWCLFQL